MKNFIFFCLCLFISSKLSAQDSLKQETIIYKDSTRFYDHSYFGFLFTRNEQFINLQSRAQQYFPREIPENLIGIVFGGKSVFGPVLVQGELGGGVGTDGRRNNGRTSLFQAYVSVDAGVMLTPTGSVRIYPFAGLGGDVASVTFKQSASSVQFDSLLSNPLVREGMKPVSFSAYYFTWRTGIAIDIGKGKTIPGPAISVRFGYRQSFNRPRWNFEGENDFMGAPTDQLKQWFGSIVFYGRAKKMKDMSRK